MSVIKSFFIAFSLYSKIPVPQFEWKKEDMKYTLIFFPFVGAVIGGLIWLWWWIAGMCDMEKITYVLIGTVIPLIITGGFHVDGYMDTMDALNSYKPREEKLRILKDSHIGAFSVIMLLVLYLQYIAMFASIKDEKSIIVFVMGFFLSRVLSAIGVVTIPSARNDGLLFTFASAAHRKIVKSILYIMLVTCVAIMLAVSLKAGIGAVLMAVIIFWYYKKKMMKEFGGITGDTAGWFVSVCECAMAYGVVIGGML
ncbi:MAG: adenosylcobinamide-GDP ribazoletransferase [Lachnospiraceae bacterium]|nr:adenosylcobinamide-GDP ribazoletransferase [Lachnospiraceae bacterium]MEE1008026.1 adenosylcobinamide-GDP ribazoletransferase [Agathobacter sp.]